MTLLLSADELHPYFTGKDNIAPMIIFKLYLLSPCQSPIPTIIPTCATPIYNSSLPSSGILGTFYSLIHNAMIYSAVHSRVNLDTYSSCSFSWMESGAAETRTGAIWDPSSCKSKTLATSLPCGAQKISFV